jgi:biotin transporter BioY
MNTFLAEAVGYLNGFVALLIILGCVAVGLHGGHAENLILALIVGILLATIFCGILALFVDMRAQLKKLNAATAKP